LLVAATDEKHHDEEETSAEEKTKEDTKGTSSKTSKTKGNSSKTYSGKTTSKKSADHTVSKGPQQLGAAVGGFAFAQPSEKRYLWAIGSPLSKLVALGAASKAREESPMPRENLTEK
jgi:hypothetical protein